MSKLCEANHGIFGRIVRRPTTWQTVLCCALLVDSTSSPTQAIGLLKKTTVIMDKGDPSGLFNASLEGNTRRAIDVNEGEVMDEVAFKALIRAAVALNSTKRK